VRRLPVHRQLPGQLQKRVQRPDIEVILQVVPPQVRQSELRRPAGVMTQSGSCRPQRVRGIKRGRASATAVARVLTLGSLLFSTPSSKSAGWCPPCRPGRLPLGLHGLEVAVSVLVGDGVVHEVLEDPVRPDQLLRLEVRHALATAHVRLQVRHRAACWGCQGSKGFVLMK
jgi:hypothetical protein